MGSFGYCLFGNEGLALCVVDTQESTLLPLTSHSHKPLAELEFLHFGFADL
jgi:hypothetical protein